MARRRNPVRDRVGEFGRRHAGVGGLHDLEQALLARVGKSGHIACKEGSEGFQRLPFGMLRRQRLHAVDGEGDLEIDRLFGPQGAIIVEGCDSFRRRHEIRSACRCDLGHEIDDRRLRWTLVPRRQGISLGERRCHAGQKKTRCRKSKEAGPPAHRRGLQSFSIYPTMRNDRGEYRHAKLNLIGGSTIPSERVAYCQGPQESPS